jgi:hypothetical protein
VTARNYYYGNRCRFTNSLGFLAMMSRMKRTASLLFVTVVAGQAQSIVADHSVALPLHVRASCNSVDYNNLPNDAKDFSAKALMDSYNLAHAENGGGRLVDIKWIQVEQQGFLRKDPTSAKYAGEWVRS